jgi:hypothetical protein
VDLHRLSPAYESFTGTVELLGGVLLFFPRTTLLGALICLIGAGEVFVLNLTYDVPVKLSVVSPGPDGANLIAPYTGQPLRSPAAPSSPDAC